MRSLVTGGAGFIGSAIARALVQRGDEVRIIDNFFSGLRQNVPNGVELVEADVKDGDAVQKACDGVDVVFHQAAVRSVPRSVDQPLLANESNVTGTLSVLTSAEKAGVGRVVYASSSSVYGETDAEVQREDQAPNPSSPYAVSKLAGEHYCRVWTKVKGLPTVSLRYFNVFGPGQPAESQYAAVFPGFLKALNSGEPPEVHWDGEQSRDFSFIDDVVRANLLAAEAGEHTAGEYYNIGGGRPKTINEVLASLSKVVGRDANPVYKPRRAGDIRRTHADISKAERDLGWRPEADWDKAVEATVAWFTEAKS